MSNIHNVELCGLAYATLSYTPYKLLDREC